VHTFRTAGRLSDQRGQTMTEFALVLPVLMLVLLAVAQFGIVFNNYVTLTDAVRAGARKAAVSRHSGTGATDAEARVREAASGLTQSDLNVSVTSSWAPGSDVTVTATYPWRIDLLWFKFETGSLTTTTKERVE
jgi:Flp pilus assembly protein TadG